MVSANTLRSLQFQYFIDFILHFDVLFFHISYFVLDSVTLFSGVAFRPL